MFIKRARSQYLDIVAVAFVNIAIIVKYRYNTIQFITILHLALRLQWQKINQILESQQTPHISPSRESYGVSIVKIWEKIDRVITAPRCIKICMLLYA